MTLFLIGLNPEKDGSRMQQNTHKMSKFVTEVAVHKPLTNILNYLSLLVMPRKNIVKTYAENGFYHVYNRGVNKEKIFFDSDDYVFFLHLLKMYLSNPKTLLEHPKDGYIKEIQRENFFGKLHVLCFCLMPNHFHLLIHQTEARAIVNVLHALLVRYVMYINKKYNRCGPLLHGTYRGILVEKNSYLLHLTRYIHKNPEELVPTTIPTKNPWSSYLDYPYSSYQYYLRGTKTDWFDASIIQNYFSSSTSLLLHKYPTYESFVRDYSKKTTKKHRVLMLDL